MVSVKLDQILIARICIMQFLGMMWLYEIILISCCEKCWDETFSDVFDWGQIINIKVSLALD